MKIGKMANSQSFIGWYTITVHHFLETSKGFELFGIIGSVYWDCIKKFDPNRPKNKCYDFPRDLTAYSHGNL